MKETAPETRYARAEDGSHVAYQVIGDGPVDVLFLSGWFGHVDGRWEDPAFSRFLIRLASFSRLILFDKRGTGASDRMSASALPSLEEWVEDARVVVDATRSQRVALYGTLEGGPTAVLFAAAHPDRTGALILANTAARISSSPDYPWGIPAQLKEQILDEIEETWGTGRGAHAALISSGSFMTPERRAWLAKYHRLSATPGTAAAIWRVIFDLDVRSILSSVHAPTLLLHRTGIRPEAGRHLAQHIPGAKFVEVPGSEVAVFADPWEPYADEAEMFLTGQRSRLASDRALATVMFTDIVGSTERAHALGDRDWKELLTRFRHLVRDHIDQFRGSEIDTRGDDFLSTFDGPARATRCALAIATTTVKQLGVQVRSGLHTGEIELMGSGIAGIAVHIGARVAALAAPGEVLVSRTLVDLVTGSGIEFLDRGQHALKGIPGAWHLFAAQG